MLIRCKQVARKFLDRSSRGVTLVEVTIAVVVLAVLVGSIPAAVMAVSNAHFRANQMRLAENLTRNEFEYIKSQEYKLGNVTYPVQYDVLPSISGFGLRVPPAVPIYPGNGSAIELNNPGPTEPTLYKYDFGIQLITVEVYGFGKRYGEPGVKPLLVSTDYKVDR